MAVGTLSPIPWFTVLDANGNPIPGALIYTYLAGTSTPVATYTDVGLTIPTANPIVCDSAGRCTIFLSSGVSYKFIVQTASGAAVRTQDNISAVPGSVAGVDVVGLAGENIQGNEVVYESDGTDGRIAGRWYRASASNATWGPSGQTVGVATGAAIQGSTVAVRLQGQLASYAGLTAGAIYYLAAAAGQMTTVIGSRRVGQADSPTVFNVLVNPAIIGPIDLGVTGQIKFPATQAPSSDPNTLDDYEEGTFLPVFGSSSGAAVYATQQGGYVKKGCEVTAWFNIGLSSKGTLPAGGYLLLGGFPFGAAVVRGSLLISYFEAMATNWVRLGGFIDPPNPASVLYGSSAPGISSTALTVNDLSNTTTLIGMASYRTTT